MSSKAPTTLLLDPDKRVLAFGYEAENIYAYNAEKVATDSDSESENEDKKKPQFDCKDLYYFKRFKMLLHENKVSIFLYIYINTEADKIIFGENLQVEICVHGSQLQCVSLINCFITCHQYFLTKHNVNFLKVCLINRLMLVAVHSETVLVTYPICDL